MKRSLSLLAGLLSTYNFCYAEPSTSIFAAVEYRQADLSWRFKTKDLNPDVYSSIQFTDLHLLQFGVGWEDDPTCCFYSRGSASLGTILDGNFHESLKESYHYYGDCYGIKGDTYGKSFNVVDGRYTTNLSYGLGLPCDISDCAIKVIPMIGYAYQEINLRVNPNQVLVHENDSGSFNGSFERSGIGIHHNLCCDLKFIQRWWGPWIGLDFKYDPRECLRIEGAFEYHFAKFKGIRYSNTGICEFDQYDHSSSDAQGYLFKLSIIQKLWGNTDLGITASVENWNAHKSHHHNHMSMNTKWHVWGIGIVLSETY